MWMETALDERFSNLRVDEAKETGAPVLATSCPFCILNFEDSVKTLGYSGTLHVIDVAEFLRDAL